MARWLLVGEWLTPVGLRVGRRPGSKQSEWGSGCLLAGASVRAERQPGERHPPDGAAESLLKKLREQLGAELEKFDMARVYTLESDKREWVLGDVRIPKAALRVLLALTSPPTAKTSATFTLVLEEAGQVVGGNTFVLRGR